MRCMLFVYALLFFAYASNGVAHELTLETSAGLIPESTKTVLKAFKSQDGLSSSCSVTALRISGGWRH